MKKSFLKGLVAVLAISLLQGTASDALAHTTNTEMTIPATKDYKTVTFSVSMHCKHCTEKISENLGFTKGVKDLKVSLDSKTVTITYDPAKTDESTLKAAIEKLGYTVSTAD